MEKKFNTDNFEQMLREATDDFRMYPSKRVWHGIYNDLHPAKKWPSFAVLLLLVTSIMYIGVANPDKGGQAIADVGTEVKPILPQNTVAAIERDGNGSTSLLTEKARRSNPNPVLTDVVDAASLPTGGQLYVASVNTNAVQQKNSAIDARTKLSVASSAIAQNEVNSEPPVFKSNAFTPTQSQYKEPTIVSAGVNADDLITSTTQANKFENIVTNTSSPNIETSPTIIKPAPGTNRVVIATASSSRDESGWMEDYAFHNTRSRDKWKGRMAYQVYVTPSLGYRKLEKTREYSPPPTNALIANPNTPVRTSYTLNHASAINLEIGTGIIYSASKTLRLKAGVQMNYTNYSVKAQELNHPTFTALMLTNSLTNGPVLSTRTSTIANTEGTTSRYLNNNTYQVSLPLGVDLHLAGNDRLKFYVGTTLQPTYILGSQSYLVSADMKNYIEEESFVRPFNINGAVEAFITYKTQSGVTLNIGPQFRAQFISTYEKRYNYDEKLYNLGIKMGMTKNF